LVPECPEGTGLADGWLVNAMPSKRSLLNAAVIPGPGTYRFKLCDWEVDRQWLHAGEFVSAVGYEETARLIGELFQVHCPVNRVTPPSAVATRNRCVCAADQYLYNSSPCPSTAR
ncbi:MAG: YddF family protein, partial [Alicyclobacillus shizuokensis]|nr:YddF family protein [Alicyclobacillus shizuokensis]